MSRAVQIRRVRFALTFSSPAKVGGRGNTELKRRERAGITAPVKAATIVQMEAALTAQILIRKGRIWTARLRIDHVVIFQASAPRRRL
jgi:hypothetical protein